MGVVLLIFSHFHRIFKNGGGGGGVGEEVRANHTNPSRSVTAFKSIVSLFVNPLNTSPQNESIFFHSSGMNEGNESTFFYDQNKCQHFLSYLSYYLSIKKILASGVH